MLRVPEDEGYEGGAHPAGNYPFLTRDFGSMVKGAVGILHTAGAPAPTGVPPAPTGGSSKPVLPSMIATSNSSGSSSMGAAQTAVAAAAQGDVSVAMGDMWVRPSVASYCAGKITFAVTNQGQFDPLIAIVRTPATLDAVGSVPRARCSRSPPSSTRARPGRLGHAPSRKYTLVCLMPGHCAAGQHATSTVTG